MKPDTKFDTEKCKKCQFRGLISGATKQRTLKNTANIICNYSGVTGITCLYAERPNKIIDRRGDDRENCKLFKEGKIIKPKDRVKFRSCRY